MSTLMNDDLVRWMFAATVFGVLAGAAAMGADRALRGLGRQARGAWMVALSVATIWPIVAALLLTREQPVATGEVIMGAPVMVATDIPVAETVDWSPLAGALVLGLWLATSLALLVHLVRGTLLLRRIRASATEREMDGELVLVTDVVGPAAIGFARARILVPAWLVELDAPLRALVLSHEREHCRTRDPMVVWLSALATALMPWNASLWWMARRLRLAIETDCDARVLAKVGDATNRFRYAKVLLLIAQRAGAARLAPMLVHTPSHLTRRIAAMHASPPRYPALRIAAAGAVVLVSTLAACSSRIASNLAGPGRNAEMTAATSQATVASPTGDRTEGAMREFKVEKPAVLRPGQYGPRYTPELRAAGVTGAVVTQFVVDTTGSMLAGSMKVLRSDDPRLTEEVARTLAQLRFLPAEVEGRKVRQLVEMPFEFHIDSGHGANRIPARAVPVQTPGGVHQLNPLRSVLGYNRAPAAATAPQGVATNGPFFDFQVDKPVVMAPGSVGPRYPDALRAARTTGNVLAQFVVGSDGAVDMSTLKVLKTSHQQFSEAVVDALSSMRFLAAEKDGRKVAQVVQQPFTFALSSDITSADKPLFDFQTDTPAMPVAGTKGPLYPDALRAAKTSGQVLIQVVVDETGQPMMSTFKVLKSDNDHFSAAVKEALAATQFTPARVGGKGVRQLVQLPYRFTAPE